MIDNITHRFSLGMMYKGILEPLALHHRYHLRLFSVTFQQHGKLWAQDMKKFPTLSPQWLSTNLYCHSTVMD